MLFKKRNVLKAEKTEDWYSAATLHKRTSCFTETQGRPTPCSSDTTSLQMRFDFTVRASYFQVPICTMFFLSCLFSSQAPTSKWVEYDYSKPCYWDPGADREGETEG